MEYKNMKMFGILVVPALFFAGLIVVTFFQIRSAELSSPVFVELPGESLQQHPVLFGEYFLQRRNPSSLAEVPEDALCQPQYRQIRHQEHFAFTCVWSENATLVRATALTALPTGGDVASWEFDYHTSSILPNHKHWLVVNSFKLVKILVGILGLLVIWALYKAIRNELQYE